MSDMPEWTIPTIVYGQDAQYLTALAGRYLDDAGRYAKRGYSEAATKGGISIDADRLASRIEDLRLEENTAAEIDLTSLQRWMLVLARGARENEYLAVNRKRERLGATWQKFRGFFRSLIQGEME